MPELLRLQADFAAALRTGDPIGHAHRWIAGDAAQADRRVAIYRANMIAAAEKALSAAYPVVRQVVGAEFFHGLAREFQRGTPSTSGDLTDFGAGFGDFLAAFEHTRSLPYLPDLSRLEWAVHRAHGAADAPAWDPAALAAVGPELQPAIRLRWSPGIAVIDSTFPVVRIWAIHQPGFTGEFNVDWDIAERALVARDGFTVDVSCCSAGESVFLAAALGGAALGEAAAAAFANDPAFDLGAFLGRVFANRLACGFTFDGTPCNT